MQRILNKVKAYFQHPESSELGSEANLADGQPEILSRDDHRISRKQLSKPCLDVLYQLKRAGYEAYLVGGAVRDLLLGLEPKDFDIVTNATPEQVKRVFKSQCRLIGRRFRLAHILFGRDVIEVATFRGEGEGRGKNPFSGKKQLNHIRQTDDSGRLLRDNIYGTLEEDVWRRDFTVNSLYYNIKDFSIVDYTGALRDIELGQIRLIGDPETRYREDPVRMIRAVRFAAKLGFKIETQTEAKIVELAELLRDVSHARMFEEVLKLFHSGQGLAIFEKLRHYHLFEHIFPYTDALLAQEKEGFPQMMLIEALKSTDHRIHHEMGVNPAFLFAAFLWEPMIRRMLGLLGQGMNEQEAIYAAADATLLQQNAHTAIPKRTTSQIKEIWALQFRLLNRSGDRAQALFEHPRFRAAYDFLGIRVAAGAEELRDLFDWWTQYQDKDALERVALANEIQPAKKKRRKRNRNPYRRKKASSDTSSDTFLNN